ADDAGELPRLPAARPLLGHPGPARQGGRLLVPAVARAEHALVRRPLARRRPADRGRAGRAAPAPLRGPRRLRRARRQGARRRRRRQARALAGRRRRPPLHRLLGERGTRRAARAPLHAGGRRVLVHLWVARPPTGPPAAPPWSSSSTTSRSSATSSSATWSAPATARFRQLTGRPRASCSSARRRRSSCST